MFPGSKNFSLRNMARKHLKTTLQKKWPGKIVVLCSFSKAFNKLYSNTLIVNFLKMDIENKIRQRVDLQETRRQQLHYKELKKQAEMEEEEEFRRQVCLAGIFTYFATLLCRKLLGNTACLRYTVRICLTIA